MMLGVLAPKVSRALRVKDQACMSRRASRLGVVAPFTGNHRIGTEASRVVTKEGEPTRAYMRGDFIAINHMRKHILHTPEKYTAKVVGGSRLRLEPVWEL